MLVLAILVWLLMSTQMLLNRFSRHELQNMDNMGQMLIQVIYELDV